MKKKSNLLLVLCCYLIFIILGAHSSVNLVLGSKYIINGGVSYFKVSISDKNIKNIMVKFQQHKISLMVIPKNQFIGFIGVNYDIQQGKYPIDISWERNNKKFTKKYYIIVQEGDYPSSKLKVDGKRVILNNLDRKRAADEKNMLKEQIFGNPHEIVHWNEKFNKPLTSVITSPFGVKRIFNGKKSSHHSGVDFRAPVGTKVKPINRGVVRLTKNLFYGGNVIIVDHGSNIFSSYSHLSEFKVREGDLVEKNQVLGLSGNTGRVTAPHLHLGIKLNGVTVNPITFIDLFNKVIFR